jgi:hypothetical protein
MHEMHCCSDSRVGCKELWLLAMTAVASFNTYYLQSDSCVPN